MSSENIISASNDVAHAKSVTSIHKPGLAAAPPLFVGGTSVVCHGSQERPATM